MITAHQRATWLRRCLIGLAFLGIGAAGVTAALAAFAYSGVYDVAADVPHTGPVQLMLEKVREHSVAVRAADVQVPADQSNPKRVAVGAGLYHKLCADCHLAPGMRRTEASQVLYPAAPELGCGTTLSPAEEFWVIKHGIKMTGMGAWGSTQSDTSIWDTVAFLRKESFFPPRNTKRHSRAHCTLMALKGAPKRQNGGRNDDACIAPATLSV